MEDGQQLHSPLFTSLATVHNFLFTLALNGISALSMNFACEYNSKNFRHEILLLENVLTKIFHTNYLELKLTQTKIKQITA